MTLSVTGMTKKYWGFRSSVLQRLGVPFALDRSKYFTNMERVRVSLTWYVLRLVEIGSANAVAFR